MEISIRSEEPKGIEQVRAILRATFPCEAESRLVDALRAHNKAIISLVAVNHEEVLGHILFSPVSISPPGGATPPNEAKGIGPAPVAVRPDVQSQGIDSKLIREGRRLCREFGFDYCVVLGNPNYYERFGFEKASNLGAKNEYGEDEAFRLIRFSNCGVAGLVRYVPEFAVLSF